jgi:hypothetical protein
VGILWKGSFEILIPPLHTHPGNYYYYYYYYLFIIIMMCGQEVGPKFVAPYLLNSHKLRGHLISRAK